MVYRCVSSHGSYERVVRTKLDIYNFISEIVSTQSWLPHFLEKERYDTYEDVIDMTKFRISLNQSRRTNNHKTTNRSFILVLPIKESLPSILTTSWNIKNSLPMFLSNFRIKLPIVSYNYINKICIWNFKLQNGFTGLCEYFSFYQNNDELRWRIRHNIG